MWIFLCLRINQLFLVESFGVDTTFAGVGNNMIHRGIVVADSARVLLVVYYHYLKNQPMDHNQWDYQCPFPFLILFFLIFIIVHYKTLKIAIFIFIFAVLVIVVGIKFLFGVYIGIKIGVVFVLAIVILKIGLRRLKYFRFLYLATRSCPCLYHFYINKNSCLSIFS